MLRLPRAAGNSEDLFLRHQLISRVQNEIGKPALGNYRNPKIYG